jgi:serine/threonine protein kinase/tetratricopeptide (TPR) repeat protein
VCPELTAGAELGHFTILERIGAGGMGEVFRARDQRLDREVAIKVLPSEVAAEPRRLARFDREAKALAKLSHPNILAIHELGEDQGVAYVATELLDGETLEGRLGSRPVSLHRALEIGAAITDGLAAAHERGVVHRDIKPSNVFLTSSGAVKILDFGLARTERARPEGETDSADETTVTQTGAVVGTPGYMSPEQVRGTDVDARSDVFSLGCVLFEMTTGRCPFKRATSAETMTAILNEEPPEIEAEPELDRLLRRCLDKDPARRFQSATDLGYALRSMLEKTPPEAKTRPTIRPRRTSPRFRRIAVSIILTIVAAAVLVAVLNRDSLPLPGSGAKSVAVLPFANLTADPDQEYFCDGMADEIINALAQVSNLKVLARTSSFSFKGQNVDVREIGTRLGVGAIVEGSVRNAGDRLLITAQLVDTANGLQLWSRKFDRPAEDVFAIQEEISLAVVGNLEVELLGREREAVTRRPTNNLEAYNECLRGWYHWNQLTPEGFARSYEHFNQAIELDPNLASAYAGLIAWHFPQVVWLELPPEAMLEAVTPLIEKLYEVDDSYLSYEVRGYMAANYEWDWAKADRAFRRALDLAPNVADIHGNYAYSLIVRGRFDEAVPHLRRIQELDPLSPLWNTWASTWLVYAGLNDEALAGVGKAVELHPQHWMPRFCLGGLQAGMGHIEEARANLELAYEMSGDLSRVAAAIAMLSYGTGDQARGDELFEMLRQRARETWVPPTILGWLHLVRGEVDEAYASFDEALQRKDPLVVAFRTESPVPIPDEPRFDELSDRLGLPH